MTRFYSKSDSSTVDINTLSTAVILSSSLDLVCRTNLGWHPHPGDYLEVEGKTYMVLERRHRYHLKAGRYRLHQIAVYVQPSQTPAERSQLEGRWVIGDTSCVYNARSELIRCAINPAGPCDQCHYYERIEKRKK
jgi:Family of unknown function (DUF6464)